MTHCRNSDGFTLAEVLITLGIIGVVAAMTLPTVIQKQQDKVTVNALKKSYSVLSQAAMRAVNEYGEIDRWDLIKDEDNASYSKEAAKIIANRFSEYMKYTDICAYGDNCNKTSRKQWNLTGKTQASLFNNRYVYIVLSDGSYYMVSSLGSCNGYWEDTNVCGAFYIDINGAKNPNAMGKDIFGFVVTPNGRVFPRKYDSNVCNRNSSSYVNGTACAEWVLVNENLDYLRCDGLEINGKTKCK